MKIMSVPQAKKSCLLSVQFLHIKDFHVMKRICNHLLVLFSSVALAATGATTARASGLQAELRSSAAIIPAGTAGVVAPTAPAGGVVIHKPGRATRRRASHRQSRLKAAPIQGSRSEPQAVCGYPSRRRLCRQHAVRPCCRATGPSISRKRWSTPLTRLRPRAASCALRSIR